MRLREHELTKSRVYTEREIKSAQSMIDQWGAVVKTIGTPGWQLLIEFFQSQLQMYDSMSNMDKAAELGDFQYRMGIVDGLNALLQSPERLKRSATSAANFLKDAELADKKE